MLFRRFVSEGLAHYSYLVGDRDRAVVIDPRRDCEVYIEAALSEGLQITHVLETHRNEDYVVGSTELAARTGAAVLHSAYDGLPYAYGEPIEEGTAIQIGRLCLVALHTPGHTPGHMSYVLHDALGAPWMVFSGDALFAGEVGRTDFMGVENLAKMTGLLYDSLFEKLLPLGDGVIVCPAHGAGSVCGSGIADRFWTTIGLEKQLNPRLQFTARDAFIQNVGRILAHAPYFRRMEELNVQGAPLLGTLPIAKPLSALEFDELASNAWIVDTRMPLSFAAAHVPGAVALWEKELPTYAGWFLDYDRPILIVTDQSDVSPVIRYLVRLGFDRIAGYLVDGMLGWHRSGLESCSLRTVTVQQLCHLLDADRVPAILDVRSAEEVAIEEIPRAQHIHIKELPGRMNEIPDDREVYVFCGSGVRSVIVSSLMRRAGRDNMTVVLGGLSGWSSASCPLSLA